MENRLNINESNYNEYKLLNQILNSIEIKYKNGELKNDCNAFDVFVMGLSISILIVPPIIWSIFSTPTFNFNEAEMAVTMLSGVGATIGSSLFLSSIVASKQIKKNIKRFKKDYPNIDTDIEGEELQKELEKYEEFTKTVIIEKKNDEIKEVYENDNIKNYYPEIEEEPKVKKQSLFNK